MMNAADAKDNENRSLPVEDRSRLANPFASQLPPELESARMRRPSSSPDDIPDFLRRTPVQEESPIVSNPNKTRSSIPDFATFKRQMEEDYQPMSTRPVPKESPSNMDDDLGFDVDELVKKIDAKIAELEAEEKKNQAELDAKNNKSEEISIPTTSPPVHSIHDDILSPSTSAQSKKVDVEINLDDESDDDDDDFFDDFFDN